MTRDEILAKLSQVVADVLGLATLRLAADTSAQDVDGWDSVAHIDIMISVERAFGVRFRTGEIASIPNAGALAERIAEQLARR